ncbi:MAG: hypothetical protein JNK48_12900 [Bryobacterales bacterium]|nr:hypothetical protein [Bryobacterales bacterium]
MRGFFAALETAKAQGKYAPDGLRRAASVVIQHKIAEARKELAQAQAALERLDHVFTTGAKGGKLEQMQLDAGMIEFAARMRAAIDTYPLTRWWMPEGNYRKADIQSGGGGYTPTAPKL